MVKDDSYQFWRRLVKKQKCYGEFTVLLHEIHQFSIIFPRFRPFFHSIKFPFRSNFVPQWSKIIPTKFGEDWSTNKKVMAILLSITQKHFTKRLHKNLTQKGLHDHEKHIQGI